MRPHAVNAILEFVSLRSQGSISCNEAVSVRRRSLSLIAKIQKNALPTCTIHPGQQRPDGWLLTEVSPFSIAIYGRIRVFQFLKF